MLRGSGYPKFGDLISNAMKNVYKEGRFLTADAGGSSSTKQFTERMIKEVEFLKSTRHFEE